MKVLRVKSLVLLTVLGDGGLFVLSYWFVVQITKNYINVDSLSDLAIFSFLPIAGASLAILMIAYDMYKNIFYRTKSDIIASIIIVVFMSSVLSIFVSYWINIYVFPRSILIFAGLLQIVMLSLWRVFVWYLRTSIHVKRRILVVGEIEEAKRLTRKILMHQRHLFHIKYIYDIDKGLAGLFRYIDKVDHVIVGNTLNKMDERQIATYCMQHDKNISVIPDMYSINVNKARLIQIDDVPMFNFSRFGLTIEQKVIKRSFDVMISIVGLVLSLPITIPTMIVMMITDPGPVFFKQERVTIGNKPFYVYKFRSMYVNAEEMTGPVLATDNDLRITKIGHFMRKTRIDEIPQLINVLNGSMSFVGPRPERAFFIDRFVKETPEYAYRTVVKAGVTGLAQVFGKYTTTFEDKLHYDLMYIENYSFFLDMKIFLKTIKVIFSKEASMGTKESEVFEVFLRSIAYKSTEEEYVIKISKMKKNLITGKTIAGIVNHQDT